MWICISYMYTYMHMCIYIALQDMPLTAIAILEAEVEARMRRFAALVSLFA